MRRALTAIACAAVAAVAASGSAFASFPYRLPDGPTNQAPNDFTGKLTWMYAATPEPGNPFNASPNELGGVRGARLVDNADVDTAWRTTTGRPDVTIAVLDSGIRWNDPSAMRDLRLKTRLNRGELPRPRHTRTQPLVEGVSCGGYRDAYDANADGVFNVDDYACDRRVQRDPAARRGLGDGPADMLDPQDVLIAFSDGTDRDRNDFVDDIVGWDFLDDDNDPYDDVQYGHGTGEARDSSAEADNGGELGACPNCMAIHIRVGDSFIADVNDFAQAVIYAVDNDVLVVQEALGTLNNSRLGRQAVEYAYDHGVTVIASAADEAAQHHNWPSSYPHVIVVNSVTKYNDQFTPVPRSYLQFNGCTNFSSKISIAVPSVSCSSDATGRGSGMAGLVYSAALDARNRGALQSHPTCRRADGSACALSANEIRQLMASGTVDGRPQADDVDFALKPELSCTPVATNACTDPYLGAPGNHAVASPLADSRRYPARAGHDQFYGWGRVNMNSAVDAVDAARIPPEVEIESPDWYEQVDPARATLDVGGRVDARGGSYRCQAYVAPGSYPNNAATTASPPGDFKPIGDGWCNGEQRQGEHSGTLGRVDLADLRSRFPPAAAGHDGREPGGDDQRWNGRPNIDAYGFTVKVIVTGEGGGVAMSGEDRRNLYLHRDRDLLPGFPRLLHTDGASSPLLVDLDRDNRTELLLATSDGTVHAFRPDGSELPGWPVEGDPLPLHRGGRAFRANAVRPSSGAFLASLAAGDVDRDGKYEVVGADYEGNVYVWSANGRRLYVRQANPRWSGAPLRPFVSERRGKRNRTQHGFLASPVLADIDQNDGGKLEIVAAAMDRHVYAWNHDGRPVRGFPTIVVDRSKVGSIDPDSHQVRFNENAGEELNQGAIIDTPAVGHIIGDPRPEIVVGTNEEYAADAPGEGGINAATRNTASLAVLEQTGLLDFGNGRLFAVNPSGDPDGNLMRGNVPYADGFPVKIGKLFTELLPVVGEGITGAPIIGPVNCGGDDSPKVGVMPDAGVSYVLNGIGDSCYGQENGKDVALQTDVAISGRKQDAFTYSAVGHPAFGDFGGGMSYVAPAVGIKRALDLALNEYQGGQDYAGVWDTETGQLRTNFPGVVNDLQFLTGPSIADIDDQAGEEALGGTAYLDLYAFSGDGSNASPAWPKLTSDWTVANPAIGSFGELDTSPDARKRVVAVTRSGFLFAWATAARPCTPASWPRFHHDIANSGDLRRDAVAPGRPMDVRVNGSRLELTAPGDDLLCGAARRYQVVHGPERIGAKSLRETEPIAAPAPAAPGERQTVALPRNLNAYLGVRALDDQGNPGPLVNVRTGRRARRLPPRLSVSVAPRRARAGRPTRFRFRVTASVRGRRQAVRGATVRFAGRRLRTDSRGRASAVATLRSGRHTARVSRRGYRAARRTVTAARR